MAIVSYIYMYRFAQINQNQTRITRLQQQTHGDFHINSRQPLDPLDSALPQNPFLADVSYL